MQIDLTDDDARTLRAVIHDYLPGLRRETARTDAREFRHEMEKRLDVCERLLEQLDRVVT